MLRVMTQQMWDILGISLSYFYHHTDTSKRFKSSPGALQTATNLRWMKQFSQLINILLLKNCILWKETGGWHILWNQRRGLKQLQRNQAGYFKKLEKPPHGGKKCPWYLCITCWEQYSYCPSRCPSVNSNVTLTFIITRILEDAWSVYPQKVIDICNKT